MEVNPRNGDIGGFNNHGGSDLMAWKNMIHGASYATATPPSEAESKKEENKVLDTADTFSASDAPELVVFIQESDYQSIKDIFIDGEVPLRGRFKYEGIHPKYHTDVNDDYEVPGKSLKIMSSISNEIEHDFQNYVRKRHSLGKLMKDAEQNCDGRDDLLHDMSVEKMNDKEFQIRDSITLKPTEPYAKKTIDDNGHLREVSSNSEAESGSTIHLSDSSLTTMSSLEEFIQGSECQQPPKAETLSKTKDRMPRSLTDPSPVSGPIPCSGSISLRSSSSTASSHSFAFPILQSEWNGSPVRMAEADPRRVRKHQSWRTCFLC